jgi:adenylate cyclase
LKLKLLPEEKEAIEQRGTTSVEAYNLYLMARRYWITGNWGDTRQLELVIRVCRKAVEIDPNYARAWGLLALVQCVLYFTFDAGDDDGVAAAARALELDPNIAEAYCVRARHLHEQGNFKQADDELAEALRLGPDSWEVNREAARIYYFQRRFAEALRHYERATTIDEGDFHSWGMLASTYQALGDRESVLRAARMAAEQSEKIVARDPTNGAALAMSVTGLAVLGDRERVNERISRALLICPDNILMRYNFACAMALNFDDSDAALDLLEGVFLKISPSALKVIDADPDLDCLREHPRYQAMLAAAQKRLGLAPSKENASPPAAASTPPRS